MYKPPIQYCQDNIVLYIDTFPIGGMVRYLMDWSLVIKAPVTNFMEKAEFYQYLTDTYGWPDQTYLGNTKSELMFLGCYNSFAPDILNVLDIIIDNCAGPYGNSISWEDILHFYDGPSKL